MGFNDFYEADLEESIKKKKKLLEDSYKVISSQNINLNTQNKNLSALYKRLGYSSDESPKLNASQSKFTVQSNSSWENARQKSLFEENNLNRPKPKITYNPKNPINVYGGATENVAPPKKDIKKSNFTSNPYERPSSNKTEPKEQVKYNEFWSKFGLKVPAAMEGLKAKQDNEKKKVDDFVLKYGYLPKNSTKQEEQDYYDKFASEMGTRSINQTDRVYDKSRVLSGISDAMAPMNKDSMDMLIQANAQMQGSKVGNAVTGLVGNVAGLAMNPGGGMNGKNLLNVTDDIVEGSVNRLTPKLGKVSSSITKGAIDGGIGGYLDSMRQNDFDNAGENIVYGTIGGGALRGAGLATGAIKNGINDKLTKGALNSVDGMFDIKAPDSGVYHSPEGKLKPIFEMKPNIKTPTIPELPKPIEETPKIEPEVISNETPANTPKVIKKSEAKDFIKTLNEIDAKRNIPPLEPIKSETINTTPKIEKPRVEPKNEVKIDFNKEVGKVNYDKRDLGDLESVSNRKIKSITSEMNELQPYLSKEAELVLGELRNAIKGKRFVTENGVIGQEKNVSPTLQGIFNLIDLNSNANKKLKGKKLTEYEQIEVALNKIKDGKVDDAISKRIELILDDNLMSGSATIEGYEIPPNADYVEIKNLYKKMSNGDFTDFEGKKTNNEVAATVKNSIALDMDGGNIKESRHASVTMPNSNNITENLKNELKNYGFEYEVSNNKIAYDKAIEFSNKNNSYDEYMRSVSKNDQDTANGIALIQRLQKEFENTTDKEIRDITLNRIVDVTSKLSDDLTNAGKTIQAASILNKLTPEGKLLSVQRQFKNLADDIVKKKNIDVKKEVDTVKKALDNTNNQKETVDTLINEMNNLGKTDSNIPSTPAQILENKNKPKDKKKPTPAELLANRVEKTITPKETKERELEKELVNTLFNISKKTLPKTEIEKGDPYSLVVNALKNKNKYQNVFSEAKKIIETKYGYGSHEYNLLSDWIEQKARPIFFEKDMDKAISSVMKEKGIKVSGIIKDHYSNTKARVDLVQELVTKGELSEQDANTVFNYVNSKMKDLTKKAKENKLKQIFTPKQAKDIISDYDKKQKAFNSIKELKYLGAFDNNNYKDLLPEKLKTQIDKIIKSDLDIGKFVREVTEQKQDVSADFMAHYIHKNTNLPQKDSDMLSQLVVKRFDELVGDKKKSILDTKFKERPKYDRNSVYERLVELDNLGVFHSEYKDLVYTKLGLPVLSPGESQIILEKMRKYSKMSDGYEKDSVLAEVNKLVQNKIPKGVGDKLTSIRYINMLLNPKTLIKNYGGNVINSNVRKGRDYLGNIIDNQIQKKTGNKTVFTPNAKAYKEGKKYGTWAAKEDYKRGIDTTDVHRENVKGDSFKEDSFIGKNERLLHYLLQKGDRPFYEGAKKEYLTNAAKHLGIDINKLPQEYQEMAHKSALEETFQNQTGIGKLVGKLTNSGNKYWDSAIKTQIPFTQTPSSILDTSMNYIPPVGITRGLKNYKKAINSGDLLESMDSQRLASNQLASGVIGTGALGLGYLGAKNGLISGSYSNDSDVRQLQQDMGIQEYALKVGDKMHSMEFAQPSAMPIMLGADYYNNKGADNMLNTVTDSMVNNSYLSGVQNLMQGYTYNKMQGVLEGLVGNVASQLTPYSSLANQINKTIDNTKRNSKGDNLISNTTNTFMSKYPVLSQMLPAKKGLYGETQKWNDGLNLPTQVFNNFINPSNMSTLKGTDQQQMALDNYNKTGEKQGIPSKTVEFTFKGEKYTPTVEEMEKYYDMLNKNTSNRRNIDDLDKAVSSTKAEFRKYIKSKHNFK